MDITFSIAAVILGIVFCVGLSYLISKQERDSAKAFALMMIQLGVLIFIWNMSETILIDKLHLLTDNFYLLMAFLISSLLLGLMNRGKIVFLKRT